MKVADSVTAVPALSYWSHSSNAVAPGAGEIEFCASATPLVAESATRNDIFSATMLELVAFRCPSATGITEYSEEQKQVKSASNKIGFNRWGQCALSLRLRFGA